ncbi:MAG: hypothetical protein VX454_11220 [Pseudomonadota bacterium]|nr:hypothetical protein [Pseudomonadota bacterium]
MSKSTIIEQVRWVKPKTRIQRMTDEDRIGRWWWSGTQDKAWGLEQFDGAGPAQIEKIAGNWLFRDPKGNYHETIRDLFSEFRLGSCRVDRTTNALDQMHQALEVLSRGMHVTWQDQMIRTVFEGCTAYFEAYLAYLEDQQILTSEGRGIADLRLSDEGHSILLMLRLTAEVSFFDHSPRASLRRAMEAEPHWFKQKLEDIEW